MKRNTYKEDEFLEEPFDIKHIIRASSYIRKYSKAMAVALFLSALAGITGLVAPFITKQALDEAIPAKDTNQLYILVGLLLLAFIVSVIFSTVRSRVMARVSQKKDINRR